MEGGTRWTGTRGGSDALIHAAAAISSTGLMGCDTMKFQAGDRVKVVAGYDPIMRGRVGVVLTGVEAGYNDIHLETRTIGADLPWPESTYAIHLDDDERDAVFISESWLALEN